MGVRTTPDPPLPPMAKAGAWMFGIAVLLLGSFFAVMFVDLVVEKYSKGAFMAAGGLVLLLMATVGFVLMAVSIARESDRQP